MKKLIGALCFVMLVACAEKRQKSIVKEMNDSFYDERTEGVTLGNDAGIDIDDGRNIVFIFDETCSACNAQYAMLCYQIEKQTCKYDSIITVVNGSDDMLIANYNIKNAGTVRPERERVIYDRSCKVSNYLYSLSENNCLMLFERKRLIYKSPMPISAMQ